MCPRKVMSYVGNRRQRKHDVDIIDAPRSTGSILKPLLYAGMFDDGVTANTLVADIPTQMKICASNFNLTFDGAVPAPIGH
jgi:penicillin-binding protein 1C